MLQRYTIRLAEEGDIHALPAVEKAAATRFLPYLEQLGIAATLLEGLTPISFLKRSHLDHRLWVATANDTPNPQPVGFIVTKFLHDSCFVVELSVHPDHGRQGIGSALIEACCLGALSRGAQQITLTTFRHVPWNIPFYQRLGFRQLEAEHWSPEIRAIVQHEARYGFAPQNRVVMSRPALRPFSLAKLSSSYTQHNAQHDAASQREDVEAWRPEKTQESHHA